MNQPLTIILWAIAGLTYFSIISYFQLSLFWQGELIAIPVQIFLVMYFLRQNKHKTNNVKKN